MNKPKEVLVLFSGGKDSSAVAAQLAASGYKVKLFSCIAGPTELSGPNGDSAPDIRVKELVEAFPNSIDSERIKYDDSYLIRKLGIERTNSTHVVYPLVLALAVHCSAICYCLKHGVKIIATGYSGYQAQKDNYIEQQPLFVKLTRKWVKSYGIEYLTPVITNTELEVKDILERYGVSSNSLEGKTIFSGIAFDKEKAEEFWTSSMPICESFIDKIVGR
jgi:tRNA U34 2-thiouridine synthase MnmA/TrmU